MGQLRSATDNSIDAELYRYCPSNRVTTGDSQNHPVSASTPEAGGVVKDCLKCKSYKDCEGHFYEVDTEAGKQYVSWYHYGEIRFCPYQVIWIIEHSDTLLAGRWPPNPEGTSYTDPKIRTGYKSEAYFIKPVEILAEVEARLKRCGIDGKLLKAEVLAGLELSQESRAALMFCKGKWRKRMSFLQWQRKVRYEKRLRNRNSSKET